MNSEPYILLLEDDFDIREAIQFILQAEGHNIKCSSNGKEALALLSSVATMPTLILLDLMMPEMNGYEFRAAQLNDPRIANIPTIVMSAGAQQDNMDQFNFTENLSKPLDLMTLIEVVKRNISNKEKT